MARHTVLLQLWDGWETRLQLALALALALARDHDLFGGPDELLSAHLTLHEAFLSGDASDLAEHARLHISGPNRSVMAHGEDAST